MFSLKLWKTCSCKANSEFVQTGGFGPINYGSAKFVLHGNNWISVYLTASTQACDFAVWHIVLRHYMQEGHMEPFPPNECSKTCEDVRIRSLGGDVERIRAALIFRDFAKNISTLCIRSIFHESSYLCVWHSHSPLTHNRAHTQRQSITDKHFTFLSNVTLRHFQKALDPSLWLVSSNFWCRADGGFLCAQKLRVPLAAKLGICEHEVHNWDGGFRRLTSAEKTTNCIRF